MKALTRLVILLMLFLPLMMIRGSFQDIKPVSFHDQFPLQKQVALSKGVDNLRPEISIQDNSHKSVDELIIMTFNICHGVNQQNKESLDLIIESIRKTQAQIIGLQEVDRFMPRSGFKDQAKEIADALGYYYVYGETINILGVKYGNAIISQFPILEHENIGLPGSSVEVRGLLGAKIDVEGSLYQVYTTHLGLNAKDRKQQIQAINLSIEGIKEPLILMGDFNGEPFNEEMAQLSPMIVDMAMETQKENVYTYAFYSDFPNTRIDRIYVSRDIEIIDHFVLESKASDHSMVLGIISIKPRAKEGLIVFVGNNNT